MPTLEFKGKQQVYAHTISPCPTGPWFPTREDRCTLPKLMIT